MSLNVQFRDFRKFQTQYLSDSSNWPVPQYSSTPLTKSIGLCRFLRPTNLHSPRRCSSRHGLCLSILSCHLLSPGPKWILSIARRPFWIGHLSATNSKCAELSKTISKVGCTSWSWCKTIDSTLCFCLQTWILSVGKSRWSGVTRLIPGSATNYAVEKRRRRFVLKA